MSITVSNPYSFNIKNNTSFTSPSIAANLPSSNTLLLSINNAIIQNCNLTIPAGVNVIQCVGMVYAIDDIEGGSSSVTATIKNNSNNKYWVDMYDNASGTGWSRIDINRYIGISPNKTYNLNIDIDTFYEIDGSYDVDIKIYYSASINNQTPNITDY